MNEDMTQNEAEIYLDKLEPGTYTCELILIKDERGIAIEIKTNETDDIVKTIVAFGWSAANEGKDLNMDDILH